MSYALGDLETMWFNGSDYSKQGFFLLDLLTTNTTRFWSLPDADTVLAGLAVNGQTFTGGGFGIQEPDGFSTPFLTFYSVADSNITTFVFDGAFVGGACQFPAAGGIMLTDAGYAGSTFTLKSSSAASGASFRDITTSTKRLRMILGGCVGNNSFTLANSAARDYAFGEHQGKVVTVGNTGTAAAGKPATIGLTGQTANIGATTLLTSAAASSGLFRISFYIKTTTAGTPAVATVKITVAYNDGAAQTADVLLTDSVATPAAPLIGHDLGTLNNASYGQVIVKCAASNAITFTTTGTYTGGAAYSLDARIEALG